ncbi:hypothetical protein WJX81_000426 [Elliptochloris bilobata]|uniref:Uncharacterized protein n=1 Tax=Elliptochloris bilobata TaxID=381761 RepID=A0AAW1QXI1_9CHLO
MERGRSFLTKLFRTDCYSAALQQLSVERCKDLGSEQRTRLAMLMTNCQLSVLGDVTFPCRLDMTLKQCNEGMSSRAFDLFGNIFANVDSICLFLLNQDFQRRTEQMLNALHGSAHEAEQALSSVFGGLSQAQARLGDIGGTLAGVDKRQKGLEATMGSNLASVRALEQKAAAMQGSLQSIAENEALLLERQSRALRSLADLDAQERVRAADSVSRWQAAEVREQAQREAAEAQRRAELAKHQQLLDNMRDIADHTDGLRWVLERVSGAQQRSEVAMALLLGRAWGAEDLAFYAAAAGTAWLSPAARAPVLAAAGAAWALERAQPWPRAAASALLRPARGFIAPLARVASPLPGLGEALGRLAAAVEAAQGAQEPGLQAGLLRGMAFKRGVRALAAALAAFALWRVPRAEAEALRRMEDRLHKQLAAAEEAIRADLRQQLLRQRLALVERLDTQKPLGARFALEAAATLGWAAGMHMLL